MSLKTACIDLQFLKWRLNFGGPLDIFHLSQQLCMKGSTSGYDQQLCLDIMMTLHTAAFLETSQHIPYFFFFAFVRMRVHRCLTSNRQPIVFFRFIASNTFPSGYKDEV